jgi:hypothetical protein
VNKRPWLEDVGLTVRGVLLNDRRRRPSGADAELGGGSDLYDGFKDSYDSEHISGYNPYAHRSSEFAATASDGSGGMHPGSTLVSSNGRKLLFAGDRRGAGEAHFARLGSSDSGEDDGRDVHSYTYYFARLKA